MTYSDVSSCPPVRAERQSEKPVAVSDYFGRPIHPNGVSHSDPFVNCGLVAERRRGEAVAGCVQGCDLSQSEVYGFACATGSFREWPTAPFPRVLARFSSHPRVFLRLAYRGMRLGEETVARVTGLKKDWLYRARALVPVSAVPSNGPPDHRRLHRGLFLLDSGLRDHSSAKYHRIGALPRLDNDLHGHRSGNEMHRRPLLWPAVTRLLVSYSFIAHIGG